LTWDRRFPPGRIAYVNGRYRPHGTAGVHIEDRGLQFGDSIYEVVSVRGGAMLDEGGHLDRLERSLKALELAMPMPREALRFVLREVMRRNLLRDGILYLQVTRGAFRRDHPIPDATVKPTLIVTAKTVAHDATAQKLRDGIKVITQPDIRWGRRDIKTTQLLPNLLAKTAARRAGAGEAWLVDEDGMVTEGGSANAWIVTAAGDVVTHPLGRAILPGVTRGVIVAAAADAQITVVERKFTLEDARQAREAFISSASGAAVPVIAIDGRPIGDGRPGPLTLRLQALYAAKTGT
jgi:D-alanine transaminase